MVFYMSSSFDRSVNSGAESSYTNLTLDNNEDTAVGKLDGIEVAKDLSGPSLKTAKKIAVIALGILTLGYGLGIGVGAYFLIKAGYKALKGDNAAKDTITQNDVKEVKQSFAEKLENKKINEKPSQGQVDLVKAKTIFHRLHTKDNTEQLRMAPLNEWQASIEEDVAKPDIIYESKSLEGHRSAVILEDIKHDMKGFMETKDYKNLDPDIQKRFEKIHDRFFNVSATDMGKVIQECIHDESYWDELCDGPMFFNIGTENHNMTMQLNFKRDDENKLKVDILTLNTGINDIEFITGDEARNSVTAKEVKNFDPFDLFTTNRSTSNKGLKYKTFFQALGQMRRESSGGEDDKMNTLYREFGMEPKDVFEYQSQGPVGICTYKSISSMMHQAISPKDKGSGRNLEGDIAWRKFKLYCLEKDMKTLEESGVVEVIQEAPMQKFYGRMQGIEDAVNGITNSISSFFGISDKMQKRKKEVREERVIGEFNTVKNEAKIDEIIHAQQKKIDKIRAGIQKREKMNPKNIERELKYWA